MKSAQKNWLTKKFNSLAGDIRKYIEETVEFEPQLLMYTKLAFVAVFFFTLLSLPISLLLIKNTSFYTVGLFVIFWIIVTSLFLLLGLNMGQTDCWRIEKERKATLLIFWREIEEIHALAVSIINWEDKELSIKEYLPIVEEFSRRIVNIWLFEKFLLKNMSPGKVEKFFRNALDMSDVYISLKYWLFQVQFEVTATLRSNLALMQKEVADYTTSVKSLTPTEFWLMSVRDAQVVRLEELSRSFERVQNTVKITV